MAIPITFHFTPHDPREALRARIERAPQDHAEALLAAYDVLQLLHERGVLDIARSALLASDELLSTAVEQANTPETIRALRNLLFLQGVLGRIEPDWLQGIAQAMPDALSEVTAAREEPVSLWRLLRRLCSRDTRYGLAAGVYFVESFGRHLRALRTSR